MTDLYVAKTSQNAGYGVVDYNLTNPVGTTQGIQLLSQRIVNTLLREYDARFNRGTGLMASLRGGNAVNDPLLRNYVALAMDTAVGQLPTGPDDETIANYEVIDAFHSNDGAVIRIRVTTVAGSSATFTLPRI